MQTPPCPQRLSYSVAEASKVIGLGRTTLYDLIKKGRINPIKVGQRTLIRHTDLEALIETN
jgi:excisionase family DNA binding protein